MPAARWTIGLLLLSSVAVAETPVERLDAALEEGKYAYVMFYRSNDDPTRGMADTIDGFVSQRSDVTSWVRIRVDDPAGKKLVDRFNASRMPLPAVVGVAPNGAVTFVRKTKVEAATLERGILTPRYCEMVKSLQNQKVAVVCLHPAGSLSMPGGVLALAKDRALGPHLEFVSAVADDPTEARFFERMRVEREISSPVVLVFAPPGAFLGRFPANVTSAALAKAIHSSGKCNCEKCRHGH